MVRVRGSRGGTTGRHARHVVGDNDVGRSHVRLTGVGDVVTPRDRPARRDVRHAGSVRVVGVGTVGVLDDRHARLPRRVAVAGRVARGRTRDRDRAQVRVRRRGRPCLTPGARTLHDGASRPAGSARQVGAVPRRRARPRLTRIEDLVRVRRSRSRTGRCHTGHVVGHDHVGRHVWLEPELVTSYVHVTGSPGLITGTPGPFGSFASAPLCSFTIDIDAGTDCRACRMLTGRRRRP